jgi:hypothetical protein
VVTKLPGEQAFRLPVRERIKVRVRLQRAISRAIQDSAPVLILSADVTQRFPVRERIKVKVRLQRSFFALESGFFLFSCGSRAAKNFVDHFQNFFKTVQDLVVPESKHPVALRLEKRSAGSIFPRSLDVLRPIQFDDEPSFSRAEVSEVRSDRMLTAKFGATHLPGSQMVPQDSFRVGLLATQATSILLGRFNRAHRFRMFAAHREKTRSKRNRILIRSLNKARCKRTLTFILSLTGRGNRAAAGNKQLTTN